MRQFRHLGWSAEIRAGGRILTNVTDLPDQVDSTRDHPASVVAMNQLLQVWQLGGDSNAVSDHHNCLILADRDGVTMRSTEYDPLALDRCTEASEAEEISCDTPARLDEKIQRGLRLDGPRGHHKGMTL